MKKVLLLGDSIRTGYAPFVRDLLDGKAEVFIPNANGAFLQNTLRFLQDWQADLGLTDGNVDVIHWNNGLWDCGHLGVGKTFELTCESAVVTNADTHKFTIRNRSDKFFYIVTNSAHIVVNILKLTSFEAQRGNTLSLCIHHSNHRIGATYVHTYRISFHTPIIFLYNWCKNNVFLMYCKNIDFLRYICGKYN